MRMTMQFLCNFYENVGMSMIWGIFHSGGNEKECHGNDNENGAIATFRFR